MVTIAQMRCVEWMKVRVYFMFMYDGGVGFDEEVEGAGSSPNYVGMTWSLLRFRKCDSGSSSSKHCMVMLTHASCLKHVIMTRQ